MIAFAASIGNLLQGWDNATISGAILYIKKEFNLKNEPTMEGLVVAMSLIGATIITTFFGALSDIVGRRPMLLTSSLLYFLSGVFMLWCPNVYVLLLARLIDGFGIGLSITVVPLYIAETAPTEIRGLLNTFPQFFGSGGMFLSYCMVFGVSLMEKPNWRLMLGVLSVPSLLYFLAMVFYLPESPRWLVSKGRMVEAKGVLQRLRGKEDVSGELALLVEGLRVGSDASIEEYIIGPADELFDENEPIAEKDKIMLYGPQVGQAWAARPVKTQSILGSALNLISQQSSITTQKRKIPFMDPLVALFASVHEKTPELMGSMKSMLFPNFGSMFSVGQQQQQPITEEWDEENAQNEGDVPDTEIGDEYTEDNLESPLISRHTSNIDVKEETGPSRVSFQGSSTLSIGVNGEAVSSMGIGSGWQVAWKWSEKVNSDGVKGGFKRIYLHQEGAPQSSKTGSIYSIAGGNMVGEECVHAAALVGEPALYLKDLMEQNPVGPAMVHPSAIISKRAMWEDLFDAGVKRALFVGIGIQILQQFAGINGLLYYTPQILEQAGVGDLLSPIGINSDSASILLSALTALLMLLSVSVAMRLVDMSGRRTLLLTTIPVLILTLLVLIITNLITINTITTATVSTITIIIYFCFFIMGFGPIPNILCSEIFPTRPRGTCVALCSLAFWIGNIIVTFSLPVMLDIIGLAGLFGIYLAVCVLSLVFVFLNVPETKGMPLEVISEFFAVAAKKAV